jgi:hypothetical protein
VATAGGGAVQRSGLFSRGRKKREREGEKKKAGAERVSEREKKTSFLLKKVLVIVFQIVSKIKKAPKGACSIK